MANIKLDKISELIEKSITKFHGKVSRNQMRILDEVNAMLKDLKIRRGRIAPAVENLRLLNEIRSKIGGFMMNDDYTAALKEFVQVYDNITKFQTSYFQQIEESYEPSAFTKEMRKQMITETTRSLSDQGIGVHLTDEISEVLRQNITSGSEYTDLQDQLRSRMLDTDTDGTQLRYVKQITTDAVNQYSAQNFKLISSDLGYEWYRYAGKDIDTTRPFCDAMTDREYFHISEIPALLRAEGLKYTDKNDQKRAVPIYARTGLPHGMIEGTNPQNFFVRRGGYQCGHQIFPVIERLVPQADRDRVYATPAYKTWKSSRAAA